MNRTNQKVDHYLMDGCGRCKYYTTPKCKVHTWQQELDILRHLVLDCADLKEELKWNMPVYTFGGKNILMIGAFKEYCAISFFKGALLKDPNKILTKHGESSQAFRLIKVTNLKDLLKMESKIKAYILEAKELEKKGAKIIFNKNAEPIPEELETKFKELPDLKKAFFGLTPGRQRGYILFFSGAKQSSTRESRINKYLAKIMAGKGLND